LPRYTTRATTAEQAPDASSGQPWAIHIVPDATTGDETMASETDGGTIGRILSVDEVSSRSGLTASDVSQVLVRRSPACLERVRELHARVREGITDADEWAEALALRKMHVSESNYDKLTDGRIPFIASMRSLTQGHGGNARMAMGHRLPQLCAHCPVSARV
jgi:hypothetical protein